MNEMHSTYMGLPRSSLCIILSEINLETKSFSHTSWRDNSTYYEIHYIDLILIGRVNRHSNSHHRRRRYSMLRRIVTAKKRLGVSYFSDKTFVVSFTFASQSSSNP